MSKSSPRPALTGSAWVMMRSSSLARPTKSCWTTRPRMRRKFSLRLLIHLPKQVFHTKAQRFHKGHKDHSWCLSETFVPLCEIFILTLTLSVKLNPIFPEALRLIQRPVRGGDDVLGRVNILRKRRDTHADRHMPQRLRLPVRKLCRRYALADAIRDHASLCDRRLRQQNAKLFPTVTRRTLAKTQAAFKQIPAI